MRFHYELVTARVIWIKLILLCVYYVALVRETGIVRGKTPQATSTINSEYIETRKNNYIVHVWENKLSIN